MKGQNHKKWTPTEIDFIRNNLHLEDIELAEHFGCRKNQVAGARKSRGIMKRGTRSRMKVGAVATIVSDESDHGFDIGARVTVSEVGYEMNTAMVTDGNSTAFVFWDDITIEKNKK